MPISSYSQLKDQASRQNDRTAVIVSWCQIVIGIARSVLRPRIRVINLYAVCRWYLDCNFNPVMHPAVRSTSPPPSPRPYQ